jgi:hypothetical protein
MALPNTRDELIDYCLRALGSPVVEINVDDDQVEDRVDEALQWFRENHPDGSRRFYISHQLSASDISNGYIDLGNTSVLTVVRMFPVNTVSQTTNFFDIKYQMMLNDITDLNNYAGDIAYYEMMQQHLSLLDMKLTGMPEITFSRQENRLYFYLSSEKVSAGDYVVVEVYGIRTPSSSGEDYNSLWNHRFLKDYTTALIKRQWGQNLIKFEGMQLPGGVTISGRQILEDATTDIERIMTKFREEEDVGPLFFIG